MRPDLDLRSLLDTRGGALLLLVSVLVMAAFAALGGLVQPALLPEGTSDLEMTVVVLALPLSLIIPTVAVLMTAGEWSDRSVQTTLLQRPGRLAVMTSKVIAASIVSLALIALAIGLAALATWVGGDLLGDGAVFSSIDGVLTTQLANLLAVLVFSLAMGLLTQSTVIGLVAAIGVPFVVGTAGSLALAFGSETLGDVIRALDVPSAAMAIAEGSAGAFELIPLALLVLLPAVLGAWRWRTREVA